MWSYYGAKTRLAKLYPTPAEHKIIEPFAGSARYSLLHFEKQVVLIDAYDVIIDIWKWLQQCSPNDILSLPTYKAGDRIMLETCSCKAEYEFLRFLLQEGTVGGNKVYEFGLKSYESRKKRIAQNLFKIKHWQFIHGSYKDYPNEQATWFIDPPYKVGGHKYKFSNKNIDFVELATWCQARMGQVIVCENMQANWLPFKPLKAHKGINNDVRVEAIWSNKRTAYDNEQLQLL